MEFGFEFQGIMNTMANSINLLLGFILENLGMKPPRMLGNRIDKFEDSTISMHDINKDHLIEKLKRFNNHWNIIKHGMIAGGFEKLTFHKDGQFYTFDEAKQDEIKSEFSEIMINLTTIHNSMLKG